MNINFKLLEKLVSVYGPSSREDIIADYIENEVKEYADKISKDPLGNLIVRKKGNGKKIMISSHMDQIGLMVTHIDDKGFIRFTNVGGISPIIILGQKFIFENGVIGIVSSEPVDDISKLKLSEMYIDIGILNPSKVKELVSIGDICIYNIDYIQTEDTISSGYLDDRVGCFMAIETLKNIQNNKNDLYFVFSVQEEVGLRGAKTAAYKIDPDIGIALDVTATGDTPKSSRMETTLGGGAAIKIKDNSVMVDPRIKNKLISIAKENNIKYQLEILEFGGTDTGAIHTSRKGVPSGAISIASRYIHSNVEMVAKEDIIYGIKLLTAFLGSDF